MDGTTHGLVLVRLPGSPPGTGFEQNILGYE
jgi:hypothetical protein